MNGQQIRTWIERQQVLAVMLTAGILISVILCLPLAALNSQCSKLEQKIEGMRAQLMLKNYLLGEDSLKERKSAEQAQNMALVKEWRNMVSRVSVFQKNGEESNVGHIDFKVKLFDVRQRLLRKSNSLNISLPSDLGVDDAIHSDEDARKRMLQLRTVEMLVNLALDLKIVTLRNIDPLPPVVYRTDNRTPFMEEYPVQMEFTGDIGNLYALLKGVIQPNSTFALKHVRIEAAQGRPGLLNVNVVLSSVVFIKDPDEIPVVVQPGAIRSKPMGY